MLAMFRVTHRVTAGQINPVISRQYPKFKALHKIAQGGFWENFRTFRVTKPERAN